MNFKDISIQELKQNYSERHGFIFAANAPCNRNNCDKMAEVIKNKGFTDSLPEFCVELNNQTFVFVYPPQCEFQSGPFLQTAKHTEMAFGMYRIDILSAFLKEHKE